MTDQNADQKLSHVDATGKAKMVDVSDKPTTTRKALAEDKVIVSDELAQAITANSLKKGNLLEVARLAGIQAAKRTDELIPLCHSLPLDGLNITAELQDNRVVITAEAITSAKTGVEMEAYTAVAVAALTVIDMGKAIDRGMVIESIRLLSKTGGQKGDYQAPPLQT